MAKKSTATSFKNATIDMKDMTITEILKDSERVYNLMEVLKEWSGIEGVSLTIRSDSEIVPMED